MRVSGESAAGAGATTERADRGTASESRRRIEECLAREPFRAPFWCRHPHLQTVWSPLFRRRPRVQWQRSALATPDGDRLFLYRLATGGRPKAGGDAPAALLLHGLEGSVASNYIRGLAHRLGGAGLDVWALEFRSCSGELNSAKRLYHSGETSDLGFVVGELLRRAPARRLYLAGFSLGGNVVGKWLGEEGERVPEQVRGAAVISPPFDLTVSGPAIDGALGGLYTRRFLRSLVPKALGKARQFPGALDVEAIRRCRTFAEFDTYATAALHGFADAQDYWARVGCGQFLAGIRRPTLLVAAADDPFNPGSTLPRETVRSSAWLYDGFTTRGGHVGFVHGSPWRTRHWAEEQVERFFLSLEPRLVGTTGPASRRPDPTGPRLR